MQGLSAAAAICISVLTVPVLGQVPPGPPHAHACLPGADSFPFCDTGLSTDARVRWLVSNLTLQEKISLMGDGQQPIPRLGLDLWNWNLEGLHGLGSHCLCYNETGAAPLRCVTDRTGRRVCGSVCVCPTVYAAPPALGATWNVSLMNSIGIAIGQEIRAMNNFNGTRSYANRPIDPTVWLPSININVEPRWGRNAEVYGEDPMHAGTLAAAMVAGAQWGGGASGSGYVQTIVATKHYTAYHVETNRFGFVGNVTVHDLLTYLTAWEILTAEAGVAGVMCAYPALTLTGGNASQVNVPMCANAQLLQNVLRDTFGLGILNGSYVQGDCGAIDFIASAHHYADNDTQAAGFALSAGADIDCGSTYTSNLQAAIAAGFTTEADLDASLYRTFYLQFLTGRFDPLSQQPYTTLPLNIVGNDSHRQLSFDSGLQGMVLLRNDGYTLPFQSGKNIAVIGPFANYSAAMSGTYYEYVCESGDTSCVPTLYSAFQQLNTGGTTYAQGCDVQGTSTGGFPAAVAAAQAADAVVVALGIDTTVCTEGTDRTSISLPGVQEQLALQIIALNKPTVIVLFTGGQIGADAIYTMSGTPFAIVSAFYPGNTGGLPVASALLGQYNKWGKLAYTVYYENITSELALGDMSMTDAPGRTYKYYKGPAIYPFGYGLSYTSFYINSTTPGPLRVAASVVADQPMSVWVAVDNTGHVAGDDVMQAYFCPNASAVTASATVPPISNDTLAQLTLVGFQRLSLGPQSGTVVQFNFTVADFTVYNDLGDRVLVPGLHHLLVTDGNPSTPTVRVPVVVEGDARVVKKSPLRGTGLLNDA